MALATIKNGLRTGRWMFLLMLIVLFLAIITEREYNNNKYSPKDIERFTQVLHDRERMAEEALRSIRTTLESFQGGDEEVYSSLIKEISPQYKEEDIWFFVYHNEKLVLWTSSALSVPQSPTDMPEGKFFKLHKTWVLKDSMSYNNYSLFAFILVRTEYSYENKVLKEGYQENFSISPLTKLVFPADESLNPIYDREGSLLFSLDYSHARKDKKLEFWVSLLLYLLAVFVFLSFLRRFLHNAPIKFRSHVFFVVILFLMLAYYLLHHFRVPEILFNLELFSPGKFASSPTLPSLGDLTLLIVSGFFIVYNFYLDVFFPQGKLSRSGLLRLLTGFFMGLLIVSLFFMKTFLVRSLILDSSIAFEAYKVLDLSVYTYLGFSLIALVFASYVLLLDKVLSLFNRLKKPKEALVFLIIINMLVFVLYFIPGSGIFIESPCLFLVISILIYHIRVRKKMQYRFSNLVIFVLLFSVYTVIEAVRLTEVKAKGDMRIFAVNLSAEHDPVAELLFVEIGKKMKEDPVIKDLLFQPRIDFTALFEEIQQKYFSSYLGKFDLQVTLCGPDDQVYISPPEDSWFHCYDFFYETIMDNAYQVLNTGFYYLDNMNGRISYLFPLTFTENSREITAFIELDSKLLSEGLGYPELLLEKTLVSNANKGYSYAKYYQGKLITSTGSFSYRMSNDAYTRGAEGFENIDEEGFNHVVYNLDKDNTIIVTKPAVLLIDTLISFSYIFGFYFFILIIVMGITGLSPGVSKIKWSFKNKIQFAMSAVLFFSLLLIGSGTVYYSIMQYKSKRNDNIKEKLQSLYVELIHKLEFEQDLQNWTSDKYYNLENLLQKFSNVFYTDINLYDKSGRLLASSRPEIFERGLVSRNMDAMAYMEMVFNQRSEFIHNESIGGLEYLSAYVPFVNSENVLLAYLNLPYFTRQDELTTEISNLVVAIVNIFVVLTLLTLTLAVFMANTITQPLRMIQEHISRFRLSEHNEKIRYEGRDEIGSLVNEYNKMIDQLEESAELLARSERESAWREMAKQIAHEIKNPLTPMRLIVQHIQRSKGDEEGRELQLEKLSIILLEQIDNLSNIATEFSNFAKMPVARNEKINLASVVQDVTRLFGNTENVEIIFMPGTKPEYNVWADKEQISRVFINLLKNAIQSISEGRKGRIEISMKHMNDKVVVSIRDNGKGISEEIRDKLFQPNFTTKTSGMGMGLAISRNIITSAGGEIKYETELKTGTVFIVELPALIE